MPIVRFDPFADLNNFQNQINDFLNDFSNNNSTLPVTDIYGDDKAVNIEVHLPHFKENEINVSENEGNLEISAEHSEKSDKNIYIEKVLRIIIEVFHYLKILT